MKFWNWINGKKTIIGVALYFIHAVLDEVVGGIFKVDSQVLTQVMATILWLAKYVVGLGVAHKMVKKGDINKSEL